MQKTSQKSLNIGGVMKLEEEVKPYLLRPIKDVIGEYPAISAILKGYDIACAECLVGTCLLKDIVSVHGLPPEIERELMGKIADLLTTGGALSSSGPVEDTLPPKGKHPYSPAMERLVSEHNLIKEWLSLIPQILKNMDINSSQERETVATVLNFIRSYADRFHHAKEEEILFAQVEGNREILQAMLEEHERGRFHVQKAAEALEKRDLPSLTYHLTSYRELLLEHIKKEDEILYPWLDRILSKETIDSLPDAFDRVEKALTIDPNWKLKKLPKLT